MSNTLLSLDQRKNIENIVNALVQRHATTNCNQSAALEKIAEEEGIRLEEGNLQGDISGVLFKDEKNGWRLVVNENDSSSRKLFTVAHELGHYFLHKGESTKFVDGQFITPLWKRDEGEKSAVKEIEANEFAGGLIMPQFIIKEECGEPENTVTNQKADELARKFGVSSLAMITRLRNLGYGIQK